MVLKKEYNPEKFIPKIYEDRYSIFTPNNGMVSYPSTFYLARVLRIPEEEIKTILLKKFNGVKDSCNDIEFKTFQDCQLACEWLNNALIMVKLIQEN